MSKIQWTDKTWNPLAGCTRASDGCNNCYAASMALRLEAMAEADIAAGRSPGRKQKYIGVAVRTASGRAAFNGTINLDEEALTEPFTWKKPCMVFVNSMSDLFHKDVPTKFIDRVFAVMALCPQHTFQVLTKRAERLREYCTNPFVQLRIAAEVGKIVDQMGCPDGKVDWPLPNAWMGVSVENMAMANERIPELLKVPATTRFVSCEPLIAPVTLRRVSGVPIPVDALAGGWSVPRNFEGHHRQEPRLHWVIIGGESGPGARPLDLEWVRWLLRECLETSTPVFVKQLGSILARDMGLKHSKGGEMEEWPEDLRVRQFPTSTIQISQSQAAQTQRVLDNVVNGRPAFEGMQEFIGEAAAQELQALSDYAVDSLESMQRLSQEFSVVMDKLWPEMPDLPDGVDRFGQYPVAGE